MTLSCSSNFAPYSPPTLSRQGRMPWAVEEFEHLRTAPARAPRVDPWRRTSGIHKVRTGRGLEIARQLWLARDAMAEQRDIAPGRVLPDAAISAAAIARPTAKEQLGALPAFSGRGTKRRIEYWWQAVDQTNKTLNGNCHKLPPRPLAHHPLDRGRTEPRGRSASAAARTFLTETAESLGMPTENLLTPDVARRLCWAPPDSQSVEAVSTFLSDHGARRWQIDLTCHGLSEALTPKESP